VILKVIVKPNSKKTRVVSLLEDGTLKVEVKAPPVRGEANRELIKFLEGKTGVPVKIVGGKRSRTKLVHFDGIGLDELKRNLL
jgi:hypothetical protein